MFATKPKLVTVDELWEMRHEPYRFTLLDGELFTMPGVGGLHGIVATNTGEYLNAFVRDAGLGRVFTETGFQPFPGRETTLFPDVAFVRAARVPPRSELKRFLRLAPDLAVEVVSPTDYQKLIDAKLATYVEAKTPEVWLLRPEPETLEMIRDGVSVAVLNREDTLAGGDLLPGFEIKVAALFA